MHAKNVQNLIRFYFFFFLLISSSFHGYSQRFSMGTSFKYQSRFYDILTTLESSYAQQKVVFTYGLGSGVKSIPFAQNSILVNELRVGFYCFQSKGFVLEFGPSLLLAFQKVERQHTLLVPSISTGISYGRKIQYKFVLGYGAYLEVIPTLNSVNSHWSSNATCGLSLSYVF